MNNANSLITSVTFNKKRSTISLYPNKLHIVSPDSLPFDVNLTPQLTLEIAEASNPFFGSGKIKLFEAKNIRTQLKYQPSDVSAIQTFNKALKKQVSLLPPEQIKPREQSKKEIAIEKYEKSKQPFIDNKARKYDRYYFDSIQKKIFCDTTLFSHTYTIYEYSDIVGYIPINQGHDEFKKHGITRTLVGGALLGPVGAIAGATTGGKNHQYVDKLGVTISLRNGNTLDIYFVKSKSFAFAANLLQKDFIDLCGFLDSIISQNQSITHHEPFSSADEIAKFKKLLDDGTITQEEFDAKKKQLLGL